MSLNSVVCAAALLVLVFQSVTGQEAPFTRITSSQVATNGGDSTGVSWTDYDQDGYLDLFVSNFGTPRNFLYRNNGDETFTRVDSAPITTDIMNAEGCVWADYDNDSEQRRQWLHSHSDRSNRHRPRQFLWLLLGRLRQ